MTDEQLRIERLKEEAKDLTKRLAGGAAVYKRSSKFLKWAWHFLKFLTLASPWVTASVAFVSAATRNTHLNWVTAGFAAFGAVAATTLVDGRVYEGFRL